MGRGEFSGAATVRVLPPIDSVDAAAEPSSYPELDCVRARFSSRALRATEDRAARLGVGADRVLIASGTIGEDDYLHALGHGLAVPFETLDAIPRALCPLSDERLIEAAAGGVLPLMLDGELRLVVAPRGVGAGRLAALIVEQPALAARFRFTSGERLTRFIMRYAGAALTVRASERLHRAWPQFSALRTHRDAKVLPSAAVALVMLGAFLFAPAATTLSFEVMLAAVFLAWLALRLTGVFVGAPRRRRPPRTPDRDLPVYSLIVALYREAASIDDLLAALERLDYPGIMAQTPQDMNPRRP